MENSYATNGVRFYQNTNIQAIAFPHYNFFTSLINQPFGTITDTAFFDIKYNVVNNRNNLVVIADDDNNESMLSKETITVLIPKIKVRNIENENINMPFKNGKSCHKDINDN